MQSLYSSVIHSQTSAAGLGQKSANLSFLTFASAPQPVARYANSSAHLTFSSLQGVFLSRVPSSLGGTRS